MSNNVEGLYLLVGFVLVGYTGWLVLFSDSLSSTLKPRGVLRLGSLGQVLLLLLVFLVLSQATILAASEKFSAEMSRLGVAPPWVVPVLDMNRGADVSTLFLNFARLFFLEELPRIGLFLLTAYFLTKIKLLPTYAVVLLALVFSSAWFALLHRFDLLFLIQIGFGGALFTLVGLKHGVIIATIVHLAFNHFKVGLFFPYLPTTLTIVLMVGLNLLMIAVLWRSLFWNRGPRGE